MRLRSRQNVILLEDTNSIIEIVGDVVIAALGFATDLEFLLRRRLLLAEPFQFEFRVPGPRVLTEIPAGPDQAARFLPSNPRFQVVLSASVDPAVLGPLVYVEMNRACPSWFFRRWI